MIRPDLEDRMSAVWAASIPECYRAATTKSGDGAIILPLPDPELCARWFDTMESHIRVLAHDYHGIRKRRALTTGKGRVDVREMAA